MKKIMSILLSVLLVFIFANTTFATNETDTNLSPMNKNFCDAVYEQIASSPK